MDDFPSRNEAKIFPQTKYFTLTEFLLIGLLIISLSIVIKYHWRRRRLYELASKINGPFSLPIIGSAYYFVGSTENILSNLMNFSNKYELPAKLWFGNRLFIGISDPEHYEIIFNHPKAFEKDPSFKFMKPVVGEGLFSAPADKWKRNRKMISPAFNQKILNDFVPIMTAQATILEGILLKNANKVIDITHYIDKCTLDIVCETSMGIKVDAQLKESQVLQWVNELLRICFERMFKIWYHPDFIFYNSPIGREFKKTAKKFIDFADEVVIEKKALYYRNKEMAKKYPEAQTEEGSKRIKSLLDLLIELTEKDQVFDNQQLRDEVCTFFVGGSDTTTSVMGYVSIMLGMFPDLQQKVYEEIMDVLGTEKVIEHTDLPKLKYTERFVLEALRVFPLGAIVVRHIEEDICLGKITVPANTTTVLGILDTHRSEKYWPDPLRFDPDRFLPEEVAKRHPYAFMAFSGGPRSCIGKKYGLMMIKCIIAQVVRKFHVTTPYKRIEDIKLQQDVVTKCVDGFKVTLTPRD